MKPLVVSHRSSMIRIYQELLASLDQSADSYADSAAALAACREEQHRLVIIDLPSIGTVGLGLCRELRSLPQGEEVCLLAIVSQTLLGSLSEIVAAGADAFVLDDEEQRLVRARLELMLRLAIERRQNHQLRESEQRLRCVVEHASVGLYQTTADGKVLLANPALVSMLGYPSSEDFMSHQQEKDSCPPSCSREELKDHIEREGQVLGLESGWTRHDGSIIYLTENAIDVRNAEGTVTCYVGTVEDVTDHRLTENALHSSEEMLRALFRPAHQCIFVKDAALRYVRVSATAKEFFGHLAESMLGHSDPELLGETAAQPRLEIEQQVLAGRVVEQEEVLTVAGEQRRYNVLRVPLRNAAGRIVGLCGVVRDTPVNDDEPETPPPAQ